MPSTRSHASLVLMAVSGFAGLGYQIVWTEESALWLGHDAAAVLAVVAAFFGGIAAGAWSMGSRIERSERPARWYAACEFAIAGWAFVLIFAMAPAGDLLVALIGPEASPPWQWTVAFVGTFVLLLPATAAMGATLPAIERVVSRAGAAPRSIAAPYAANTIGAVGGVLASAFWLVPALGLAATAAVCIASSAACGVAALVLFPSSRTTAREAATPGVASNAPLARLLFVTGLLGIGYEVLVVLVLGQVTEDTVYTFALLLAVYLVFTAAGAATYREVGTSADRGATDRLSCALAIACLFGLATLWFAEDVKAAFHATFGDSLAAALAAEAVLAMASFAAPTFVMGALFSHLCDAARAVGMSYGRALGINVSGAALAPVVFGVLLAPAIGLKASLLVLTSGYLALVAVRTWRRPIAWLPAATVGLFAIAAPPLAFIDLADGGRVVSYRQGVMAAVSVVEDARGIARLRINNRQQEGTSATRLVDGRQALLPLLLQGAPHRALFLGLGTGVTASSALADPDVEIDAVELLPEVIEASTRFRHADDPRLHLRVADARRYVRTSARTYDVIVADNYHPARSGAGALYTIEHFRAIRERLAADGLFCQWLPLHQLDLVSLRSIVQSFLAVYPEGTALLANNSLQTPVVGLIARRDGARFDGAALRQRIARTRWIDAPADFGLDDAVAVLGSFVAGPRSLARFAGDAPANTDDRPIVAYRAPRITYAPDSSPADRLGAILDAWTIAPADLIDDADHDGWDRRLAAYWSARQRFIAIGRTVRPTDDPREMLVRVQEPLFSVLRISPDFRPAYDPLLRMAIATARTNGDEARRVLAELERVQPARTEAIAALRDLDRLPAALAAH